MAQYLQHCIGKYTKATELEETLLKSKLFLKKIIDQVFNRTHYVISLLAMLMLTEELEKLKWDAF